MPLLDLLPRCEVAATFCGTTSVGREPHIQRDHRRCPGNCRHSRHELVFLEVNPCPWTPRNYLTSLYWELHNFPKLSFKNWKQRSANTITWNLNSQKRVLVVQSWCLIWRLMTKKLTSVKWVTHNFKSKRS